MAQAKAISKADTDDSEPFVVGVMSRCCGALVLRVALDAGTWYECKACGAVVE